MTGKLNIFYIEDNPKPEDILIEDLEYFFPDSDYFNLFIFQHPNDLYEYLKSLGQLNLNTLSSDCPEAIPAIVIFDYQMSDNLSFNNPGSFRYSNINHLNFLKTKNIALLLKNRFEDQLCDIKLLIEELNFEKEVTYKKYYDFNENYSLDFKQNKGNDEFGLFMGITLLKQFENTPIFCQPSTRAKSNKDDLSKSAKFYEWINSVNAGKAVGKNITDNIWENLLEASLIGLRERTVYQVERGIIAPNYIQLKKFTSDDFKLDITTCFEFNSKYGVTKINLNSLFYDKDESARLQSINEWSSKLIRKLINSSSKNLNTIDLAISKYNKIYNIFQKHFTDRILLSYFFKKEQVILDLQFQINGSMNDNERLRLEVEINNLRNFFTKNDNEYEVEYNRLKKEFKVVDDKISDTGLLCSVQQEYSYFTGNNKKDFPIEEARLLVLLLVTRIWIDYQVTNEEKPLFQLENEDYYNVLHPVINTYKGLVLLMHCEQGNPSPSDYLAQFQKYIKSNLSIEAKDLWSFNWIDDGEKIILKSFFQEELSKLTNQPEWLL